MLFSETVVGGAHAAAIAVDGGTEIAGFEGVDVGDVGAFGNREVERPVDAVYDEAAEVFAFEVDGGADGADEDFVFTAGVVAVEAGPDERHHGIVDGLFYAVTATFFRVGGGGRVGFHAGEDLAAEEDFHVGRRIDLVDIGGAEDVADAVEERFGFGAGFDDGAGGLVVVMAPVIDPVLAEDVFAELGEIDVATLGIFEGVGGGAERDDGDAAAVGVDEVFHLVVGVVAPAEGHDDDVGGVEGVGVGEGTGVVGVDDAVGIEREEDGAFEAVALAEDFREHGQRFLAAVFLVAGEQDDVLVFRWAGGFEDEGAGVGCEGGEGQGGESKGGGEGFHGGVLEKDYAGDGGDETQFGRLFNCPVNAFGHQRARRLFPAALRRSSRPMPSRPKLSSALSTVRRAKAPRLCGRASFERIIRLHERLSNDQPLNAESFAKEFGVSSRSIKRDIDFLRARLDVPIAWDPSAGTYYYTRHCDLLPLLRIDAAEALALALAGRTFSAWAGSPLGAALTAALEKIATVVSGAVSVPGDTLQSLVFAPAEAAAEAEHRFFAMLLEAIRRRRELQLDYQKPRNATASETRTVHPLHLAYLEHRWVLVAHDAVREGPRNFLLARIRGAKFTSRLFEPPKGFDLQQYLNDSFGRFSGRGKEIVRVVFDAEVAPYLRERPWHRSQRLVERGDGGVEASFEVSHLNDIERRVLSCGAHAHVLAPDELRERMKRSVAAMAALYAGE